VLPVFDLDGGLTSRGAHRASTKSDIAAFLNVLISVVDQLMHLRKSRHKGGSQFNLLMED
jgi:hypothetical protein